MVNFAVARYRTASVVLGRSKGRCSASTEGQPWPGYREVPWVRIPLSPPFSLLLQRLPLRTPEEPENSPRFRGILAVEPRRIRTGEGAFRAGRTAWPEFVSVAMNPRPSIEPRTLGFQCPRTP